MKNNKHISFKIQITSHYLIQLTIENDQTKETIKLNNNQQQDDYSPITISFDMNEILINEQKEDSIQFMKDWIDNPQEFKQYKINYQNKEYSVISEVLFALFINEYKQKIEKDYIIDETIVEVPTTNCYFVKRILISLESIGLKEININSLIFDYKKQGEILHEIIEKKNEYNKYKNMLSRSKQTHLFDNKKPLNEESFEEIIQQLSIKERSEKNLCQLDNYCLFLSSKWFDSFEDHLNFIQTSKRLELNMTKFHFNPLSLTPSTRELFPNLQTLYRYSKFDYLFNEDERIIARENCKNKKYDLWKNEMKQLEEWTGLKCGEILFDSNKDDWSQNSSEFDSIVMWKKQLLFIIDSDDGQKFGYYLNTQINDEYAKILPTDEKSFIFNLESNGRLKEGMMKFELKETSYGYRMWNKDHKSLIYLGDLVLLKKENKNKCYCFESKYFDYHNISKAVSGKCAGYRSNMFFGDCFEMKRLIVIQME